MRTLHITNGNALTHYLQELNYDGDFLTWQEMLCEGPTRELVDSDEFFEVRKQFLLDFYDIEVNEEELRSEIDILNHLEPFTEIILWFEYDLFCHINLMAVISLLAQKQVQLPIFLVCSGRVEGERDLKSLSDLTPAQLKSHYASKIRLTKNDIDLMKSLWKTYCGSDHNLFKSNIVQQSAFKYVSNCLKAHLERFPDTISGLSILEHNILVILDKYSVNTRQHLLGYALNYQGYFGFSDMQLRRKIDRLSIFYDESSDGIQLNEIGRKALNGLQNVSSLLNNDMPLGGVNRSEFQFSKEQNKLIKIT